MNTQQQPSNDRIREQLGWKMKPKFEMVYCSQCGKGIGPGNEGFSSCDKHAHLTAVED